MKILLINPIARVWALPNCYPTGLGYIASVLLKEGHEVDVIDRNAERLTEDDFVGRLSGFSPDFIGLTGIITQYAEVKRLAEVCREVHPMATIICGGPLASAVPKLLLKRTGVNICVVGEGERTIVDFLDQDRKGVVHGLQYVNPFMDGELRETPTRTPMTEGELGEIPWPKYDLFPMETYLRNPIGPFNPNKWRDGKNEDAPVTMNLIGTRGCPYRCLFCTPCFADQGYRKRPIRDLVDEMNYLRWRYRVDYFHFGDDAFACSKRHVMEFCEQKMALIPDAKWGCSGRANLVDEDMVKVMAESGCVGLWYGLESGSQRMLDAMDKRVTVWQYERAIGLNREHFQYEDYTFIVGSPGETDETIDESIAFCRRNGVRPSAVFYMTPYPGTPLFKRLNARNGKFRQMVTDEDSFERWITGLGEQGERMAWNCSGAPDEKVREWHQKFIEETGACNKDKH